MLAQGHREHPSHFGHPAPSAVLNPAGHTPCKRISAAHVKYCIYVAPLFPVYFFLSTEDTVFHVMSFSSLWDAAKSASLDKAVKLRTSA